MPIDQTTTITWSAPVAPQGPTFWWTPSADDCHLTKIASKSEHDLESGLQLIEGTLAALQAGFSANIPRTHGWNLTHISDPRVAAAFAAAARWYKRGVVTRPPSPAPEDFCGSYPLTLQEWPIGGFAPTFAGAADGFYVCDSNLPSIYSLLNAVPIEQQVVATEQKKELSQVAGLLRSWAQAGRPKHWIIIGGGITGDLAAFAAANAGCEFSLVPTTLLAMVDACVGGKTGVNFPPYGKNQLGLFAFPKAVYIYPQFLESLPVRDFISGIAECLKHALLIGDRSLASYWANLGAVSLAQQKVPTCLDPGHLMQTIQLKADVVRRDPTEDGERAILNFGHTLAHAIESLAQSHGVADADCIKHGEAVGIGISFACHLSTSLSKLPSADTQQVDAWLQQAGLLTNTATIVRRIGEPLTTQSFPKLLQWMVADKKQIQASTATTRWILLDAIGKTSRDSGGSHSVPVETSALQAAWQSFVERWSV